MTDRLDPPIVVNRWTRYGKDRAYASVGGVQIGYRDLHSGEIVGDPERRALLEHATEDVWRAARTKRYRPRHAEPAVSAPDAPSPSVPTTTTAAAVHQQQLLPDRDLRDTPPGAAVRAHAQTLRDAAPVRTRVKRLFGVKNDERAWRIGGDAEEAVAKRLARLGPGWHVLHALPVGENGSDIDHLVVGPGGVFTVNAKNHPDASVWVSGDTVRINGHHQPYVRNSRFEARRAAKLLTARAGFDVEVHGLVAIVGMQKGFTVVEQPRDGVVSIVPRRRIAEHLAALPVVLGAPSIERIHDVARHLATWQPLTVAWSDQL